jgi:hypothetical protein
MRQQTELASNLKTLKMKLITFITTIIVGGIINLQSVTDQLDFSIKKANLTILNGKCIYTIPTIIHNKSKDTLYYFSMSCSWKEFYTINNPKFKISMNGCDKNIPKIIKVNPHDSNMIKLQIETEDKNESLKNLKVGFNFIDAKSKTEFDFIKGNLKTKKNIIWSNNLPN